MINWDIALHDLSLQIDTCLCAVVAFCTLLYTWSKYLLHATTATVLPRVNFKICASDKMVTQKLLDLIYMHLSLQCSRLAQCVKDKALFLFH